MFLFVYIVFNLCCFVFVRASLSLSLSNIFKFTFICVASKRRKVNKLWWWFCWWWRWWWRWTYYSVIYTKSVGSLFLFSTSLLLIDTYVILMKSTVRRHKKRKTIKAQNIHKNTHTNIHNSFWSCCWELKMN